MNSWPIPENHEELYHISRTYRNLIIMLCMSISTVLNHLIVHHVGIHAARVTYRRSSLIIEPCTFLQFLV